MAADDHPTLPFGDTSLAVPDVLPPGWHRPAPYTPAAVLGAQSLTAAARRINIGERSGAAQVKKARKWQSRAWELSGKVPEAKFSRRFVGNALSRCVMYPGVVVDPRDPPVDMADILEDPELRRAFPWVTPQLVADCREATDRLARGGDGMTGIMRAYGETLTVTGESWHIIRGATPDDATIDDEVAVVVSADNLVKDPAGRWFRYKEAPDDEGIELGPDTLMYRVWRRDAQWPAWADSNMSSILDELDELLIYSAQFRAVGRSRNTAGILGIPIGLDREAQTQLNGSAVPANTDGTAGAAGPTPGAPTSFDLALMRSMIEPVQDDGSAASVIPHIIKGDPQLLAGLVHLTMDRKIDDQAIARMEFLIRRVAHGVDLPVEILTGLGQSNHWSGWLIEDTTWKAHLEPTAAIPAAGLTNVHLRPTLQALGYPPDVLRQIAYGVDPSALVVRPNRSSDAQNAYVAKAISAAAYRKYLGFPESDAPDMTEQALRYVLERGIGGQDITAQLLNMLGVLEEVRTNSQFDPLVLPALIEAKAAEIGGESPEIEVPGGDEEPVPDDDEPVDGGDPTPSTEPGDTPDEVPDEPEGRTAAALVAAAALPTLGDQLARIEERLRDRIQSAASTAMNAALSRAGSRLRATLNGPRNREAMAKVKGQPADQVGRILVAAGFILPDGSDSDRLLDGAFDSLESDYRAWVRDAEAAAGDAIVRNVGRARMAAALDPAVDAVAALDNGWRSLRAGLHATASARVFEAAAEDAGEVDLANAVPAGIVRDSLAVAGGGTAAAQPVGTADQVGPPGLLTGPRWLAVLNRADIITRAWRWEPGFASTPFPPHHALAGVLFQSWQDEALATNGGWPGVSHYYPGDHKGCVCTAVPELIDRSRIEPTGVERAATGAALVDIIYAHGDASLSLEQAVRRSQSEPVTTYGLSHGEGSDLVNIEYGVSTADLTPTLETIPLDGLLTTQATVNPHYLIRLYEDPLAAVEGDASLLVGYHPQVWRLPDGRLVLQDGRHRAIANAARNGGTFEAEVFDIPESALRASAAAGVEEPRPYGRHAALAARAALEGQHAYVD